MSCARAYRLTVVAVIVGRRQNPTKADAVRNEHDKRFFFFTIDGCEIFVTGLTVAVPTIGGCRKGRKGTVNFTRNARSDGRVDNKRARILTRENVNRYCS